MKVLYCVSDHGYGHASRSLPILKILIHHGHEIVVRNNNAAKYLHTQLQGLLLRFIEQRSDVGKSGYSIAAEAIRCRKPMVPVRRPGFAIDKIVTGKIRERGIGEELLDRAAALQNNYNMLPARFRDYGTAEAAQVIEGLCANQIES